MLAWKQGIMRKPLQPSWLTNLQVATPIVDVNIFFILCKRQIGAATFSGYFNRKRTKRKNFDLLLDLFLCIVYRKT